MAESRQAQIRSRGRPKQISVAAHRQAITNAAWPLFLEKGYRGTTVSKVAAAAHVSLRTVYQIFPGKLELFASVVEEHRHSMVALPADYDHLPMIEALYRIFQIDIDAKAQQRRLALLTMFIEESRQFPELGPILQEHGPDHARALLVDWLEHQQQLGRISVSNADFTAQMLMDVVFGASSLNFTRQLKWPGAADRKDYLGHCLTILIKGLQP
ncbi:TetR/AcrR family transcriptional regulator [uncultured Cohaesibacter sp.]|uniref:TetR/AcrR family transcriptional regulator n=1 Tax=uncultured Cohaesibacter sp. TaxID=1002546 RepID=UPI00292DF38B|nr:TetR/AcrR family transcriptional regulator [uncultured Cohaesibacter sp.]